MADKILSLAEVKSAIRSNMGSPMSNQNAATALAGTRFRAENARGEKVIGTILEKLSPKGKLQAEMGCLMKDCNETHVREQSDWHQSLKCRTHSSLGRMTLTEQEKAERRLDRAKSQVKAIEQQLHGRRGSSREIPPPGASPNGH